MTTHKLILHGRVPSKKNSKRRIQRGKHIFMVPSLAHEDWHREQTLLFRSNAGWRGMPTLDAVVKVEILFFVDSKRAGDLSNKAESIMDFLVDMGVLKDDNWFVVPKLNLALGGIDKENPRAEIEIFV